MIGRVIILVLISSIVLISCTHDKKIKCNITRMSEKAIVIETDSMVKCKASDSIMMFTDSCCALKMVVWVDSTECSSCYIRQLELWKDFVKLESENPDGIKFCFIFETQPEKLGNISKLINSSQLEHPIYIDTVGIFRRNNPGIPADVMYHTFLLDSDNNVILVGNPIKNNQVQILFNKILNEKIGISVNNEESL